mmetsp:Transcript_74891/g.200869  ORF Transcript_74891/g.200869 Transcript_74891/m.200869 type:complete len:209 (-) Transcript_74891:370-996(-)
MALIICFLLGLSHSRTSTENYVKVCLKIYCSPSASSCVNSRLRGGGSKPNLTNRIEPPHFYYADVDKASIAKEDESSKHSDLPFHRASSSSRESSEMWDSEELKHEGKRIIRRMEFEETRQRKHRMLTRRVPRSPYEHISETESYPSCIKEQADREGEPDGPRTSMFGGFRYTPPRRSLPDPLYLRYRRPGLPQKRLWAAAELSDGGG